VTILAKSGVAGSIASDTQVFGMPAIPHKEQARIMMTMEKLPEMRKDVRRIKQHLGLEDS
jgi:UDP-3-O-[3-hydroxymyristoyl] glucosamine N-acyltransferase